MLEALLQLVWTWAVPKVCWGKWHVVMFLNVEETEECVCKSHEEIWFLNWHAVQTSSDGTNTQYFLWLWDSCMIYCCMIWSLRLPSVVTLNSNFFLVIRLCSFCLMFSYCATFYTVIYESKFNLIQDVFYTGLAALQNYWTHLPSSSKRHSISLCGFQTEFDWGLLAVVRHCSLTTFSSNLSRSAPWLWCRL